MFPVNLAGGFPILLLLFTHSQLGVHSVQVTSEKRLRDDLLQSRESLVRPVKNWTDTLQVQIRVRLVTINGLDLKNQVLSLNLLIEQEWHDYKFQWDPDKYEGIPEITLPSNRIWLPDIVQYNRFREFDDKSDWNEDPVKVYQTGVIHWVRSSVSKTFCFIEVRYYPFDIQTCKLDFASWTYDGSKIYLTLKDLKSTQNGTGILPVGMDLRDYYPSAEWDLISIPATWTEKYYPNEPEPYFNVSFKITLRRRAQFYLYNLVLPLTGLSYLSLLVFYLPADSGEKITLAVSLLACQVMFLLLMMDSIPITSLAVPLLGKLIVFNMTLNFMCVLCTTVVLNIHYRNPNSYKIPDWVRRVRDTRIPKLLLIDVIPNKISEKVRPEENIGGNFGQGTRKISKRLQNVINDVGCMKNYAEKMEQTNNECDDWKFLASILDRIFLIIFNLAFFIGFGIIMMDAPALYDKREAVNKLLMGNRKVETNAFVQQQHFGLLENNTGYTNELDENNTMIVFDE